jgi:hypothetical protein
MRGLAFILCLGLIAGAQAASPISTIDIQSDWGGLGQGQSTTVHITRGDDGYSANGAPVSAQAVADLLAALQEPDIDSPTLANLGIDAAWIDAHSAPEDAWDSRLEGQAPNQLALYKRAVTDPKNILHVVGDIYSPKWMHTDDFPHVQLAVTFADGSKLTADSMSQPAFMLPWEVKRGGDDHFTYNARISRAVAALLPEKGTNKGRLAGEGLASEIAEHLMFSLEDSWNTLDAENRAPAAMALLRTRYTIRNASIDDRNHIDYLTAGMDHIRNLGDAFDAELTRKEFPPNLSVSLELPFEDGKVDGADRALQSLAPYEELVLSTHWLMDFLRTHPKTALSIDYLHGTSMSENALAAFAADMHVIGKDDLAAAVGKQRDRVAVLSLDDMFDETAWLLLPDHRMALWHYAGKAGLLKWTPRDFSAQRCKGTSFFNTGGCVGAIISPQGEIVDRSH